MNQEQYLAMYFASRRKVAKFLCMGVDSLERQVSDHGRRYGVPPHQALRAVRQRIYHQLTCG